LFEIMIKEEYFYKGQFYKVDDFQFK